MFLFIAYVIIRDILEDSNNDNQAAAIYKQYGCGTSSTRLKDRKYQHQQINSGPPAAIINLPDYHSYTKVQQHRSQQRHHQHHHHNQQHHSSIIIVTIHSDGGVDCPGLVGGWVAPVAAVLSQPRPFSRSPGSHCAATPPQGGSTWPGAWS